MQTASVVIGRFRIHLGEGSIATYNPSVRAPQDNHRKRILQAPDILQPYDLIYQVFRPSGD
jgi:hypothetical protein